MIPKIIHYCWFGKSNLPKSAKACIRSWQEMCPDYEIRRWDESNFDIHSHPFVESAYRDRAWAFVSDYVRLWVVYKHGGIYLDTDVELLRSPDFLLENRAYMGLSQGWSLCNSGLGFGAEKGSPVVLAMLKKYDSLMFDPQKKDLLICPILTHPVIAECGDIDTEKISYLDGITVYPAKYFDPISMGNTLNLMCPETVSIHHYTASWTSYNSRFKRSIVRFIGPNKAYTIKHWLHKLDAIIKPGG